MTTPARRRAIDRGILGSLLGHAVLVAAVANTPLRPASRSPVERGIEVQIVPEARPVPPGGTNPGPPPTEQPRPPPRTPRSEPAPAIPDDASPRPEPSAMVVPKRMLSTRALADARSREARAMLRRLTTDERVEQLCDMEAMAQIAAWRRGYRPDRLVAYAMADTRMSAHTLIADGAAFHSGGRWFNVRFRCSLTADHGGVASFAFDIGAAIPRNAWPGHNLAAEDGRRD